MSHAAAQQCFESELKKWADAQAPIIRISYPNKDFKASDGEVFLRAHTLPADTRNDDISLDTQTYVGIFQVDVVYPKNTATAKRNAIVDELTNVVFRRNTWLTQGAFKVQVTKPVNPGPEIEFDAARMFTPCSVNYWARLVLSA